MPSNPTAKPRRKQTTIIPERDVQQQVIEGAAMLGITLDRRNVGMAMGASGRPVKFGEPGDPDLCGELPSMGGRSFHVEVKKRGKKPTDVQLHRLKELNARGSLAVWTDDAEKFIRVMGRVLGGEPYEIDENGVLWVGKD